MRILISLSLLTAAAHGQAAIEVTRAGAGTPTAGPADHFTGSARIDTAF